MAGAGSTSVSVLYFGLILLFLYGPIIVMALLSFQGPQGGMTFPLKGVSLHWWQRLFGERAAELGDAIVRTLVVAVETGLIAAAFSLIIAFAYRRRLPGTRLLFPTVLLALMTPGILLGLGVSLWWRILNLQPGHLSLLGVHVVWALPFAFLVMLAVLNRFDPGIEESARDLGAGELRTFFEVVFPIIWPGVLSAALFGFTLSLNEFERQRARHLAEHVTSPTLGDADRTDHRAGSLRAGYADDAGHLRHRRRPLHPDLPQPDSAFLAAPGGVSAATRGVGVRF